MCFADRARDGAPRPPARSGSRRAAAAQLRHRRRRCPYTTPPGAQYDSGDYPATLRRALRALRLRGAGAPSRPRRRPAAGSSASASRRPWSPRGRTSRPTRSSPGAGRASGSAEAAMVRGGARRHVRASIGDPPSGQGYETVIAQIVADELGLTPDAVHGRPRLRLDDHALALPVRQLLEQVLRDRRGGGGGRGGARARTG